MAGSNGGGVRVLPLFMIGGGVVFVWSGLTGRSWSAVIKDLIKGTDPRTAASINGINLPPAVMGGVDNTTGILGIALTPTTKSAAQNQQIAKMLVPVSWRPGTKNWDDLVLLWDRESGWSNTADNASSGAYGIPQSLPYTKMPRSAWPPSKGGKSDPVAQIQWGIGYIAQRYGSPAGAWAHEQSAGWY